MTKDVAQGRELFEREWLPGDSRAHGGDGLGPVYNDSSCVACHNLGGSGGGGAASKNVDIITATPNAGPINFPVQMAVPAEPQGFLATALGSLVGIEQPGAPKPPPAAAAPASRPKVPAGAAKPARSKIDTGPLVAAHPGFRTARSVVLHRFGLGNDYEKWRQSLLGLDGTVPQPPQADAATTDLLRVQTVLNFGNQPTQAAFGQFVVVRSQRNATALFGTGLIDSIPERVIEEAAKAKNPEFPELAGRVSRLKDKRIGRFGWKAQTASLSDFVLTACAVELGLEVPGHHQGGVPQQPEAKAGGLDLSAQECESLVSYVRALPRPAEREPAADNESRELAAGRALFAKIGCAGCHTPKLGDVAGIYSDLLLHDLGPQLGDTGQYGVFDPSSSEEEITDDLGPIADLAPAEPPPAVQPGTAALDRFAVAAPAPPPPTAAGDANSAAVDAAPLLVPPPTGTTAPVAPAQPQGVTAPVEPPGATVAAAPVAPAAPSDVAVQLAQDVVSMRTGAFVMQAGTTLPFGSMPKRPTTGPASRFEWRTPPLWGFRDSGPYLHDGRAATLDQAVALHEGEAARITRAFFGLTPKERSQVEAFLKSLTAPDAGGLLASAAR
jgi:CxxC motif-containing protein (DUF1111 family)